MAKFRHVMRMYMSKNNPEWVELAPGTKRQYENHARYLGRFFDLEMNDITRLMIVNFRDDVMVKSKSRFHMAFMLMRNTFCYAYDRGLVTYNHTLRLDYDRSSEPHKAWPKKVIDRSLEEAKEVVRRFIILALYTGQRVGDVLNMKWVDYDGECIAVRAQQKTKVRLEIPVHPALREMLEETPEYDRRGYIIQNIYEMNYSPKTMWQYVKQVLEEIGAGEYTQHGLRKSAAVFMAEAGCTPHQIAAVTGHRTLAQIQEYTREVTQKTLAKEAMSLWK